MFKRYVISRFGYVTLAAIAVGCARSATPVVEDLVKVRPPSFNQSLGATILAPSINFVIRGECDSTAYSTEYVINDGAWTELPCTNDAFSFATKINGRIKVSARSKGKFSYSDIATANVRFVAPPTSDTVVAVASSKSDSTDQIGFGTQNALGSTFEGNTASSGTRKIHSFMPRVVYEQ